MWARCLSPTLQRGSMRAESNTLEWEDGRQKMATRMTSARFVGRAGELAELEAAFRDAVASRSSLVLVAGESGVGKSRLVDELIRRARALDAVVLAGDCV